MNRWSNFGIGAATFAATHLVEAAMWRRWFDPAGAHPAWFLNSGPAATLVVVSLFLAGVAVGVARNGGRGAVRSGCWLAAGASASMALVLYTIGAGTIFPIVLVFGVLIAGVSSIAGAIAGSLIGRPCP